MRFDTIKHDYEYFKAFLGMYNQFDVFASNSFRLDLNVPKIDSSYLHFKYINELGSQSVFPSNDDVINLYGLQYKKYCDFMGIDPDDARRSSNLSFGVRIDGFYCTNTFIRNFGKMITQMYENGDIDAFEYEWEFLLKYFSEYGNGFSKGFNRFVKFISDLTAGFDSSYRSKKIFEFAIHKWDEVHEPPTIFSSKPYIPNLSKAYDAGEYYGMLYRAWTFILSDQSAFQTLAQDRLKQINKDENRLSAIGFEEFYDKLNNESDSEPDLFLNEIDENESGVEIPVKKFKSFEWKDQQTGAEKEKLIFNGLKELELIECDLTQFRKVFSGDNIDTPIIWKGDSVHLVYLFGKLIQKNFLQTDRSHWKQLRANFEYNTINETVNFSQIDNGHQNLSNKIILDSLIKSISTK
ncbi:hypothetical protein [Leeuwenhoekiella aestuarii]|uniref:Uncharacterized protein n=1 Tax=Leeuwenhoekiella aestuarii TaxID=2249426 RepID=A0A4Q0NY26_9FLAO|nr:hypothetical protein [Leeuwenhoekiella aestuarii]RXG16549.1 hypothetical protein DSM04_102122 [Leeuwenhoekiella aestuarii]